MKGVFLWNCAPGVMGNLSKWEPITPVGLSVIDEDLQVLFDLLVDSLRLTISLWVEGCGCI